MAQENLSWVGVAVGRLIGIGDSDIKDCCLAFGPKAINSKVLVLQGRLLYLLVKML
jgi:hypothetical protein